MHSFEALVPDVAGSERLARAFAKTLALGDVIVLEGTLGAGKTTFVGLVAHALGLPEDEYVTSPTFAIVHELDADLPLLHADLYRLSSEGDVASLGLEEQLGKTVIAFVEWGERFERALGGGDLRLRIHVTGDEARRFVFEPISARGEAISHALSEAFAGEGTP